MADLNAGAGKFDRTDNLPVLPRRASAEEELSDMTTLSFATLAPFGVAVELAWLPSEGSAEATQLRSLCSQAGLPVVWGLRQITQRMKNLRRTGSSGWRHSSPSGGTTLPIRFMPA